MTCKKMIMLTGFYSPSIGGMEKRLEKWAAVLIKNDIEVEVFTTRLFSDVDTEYLNKVKVIRQGATFGEWTQKAANYLDRHCDSSTVVLIAALGPGMDAGLLHCLHIAHQRNSKVIMSVPTADHIDRAIARHEGADRLLAALDRLVTVSDDVREFELFSKEVIYIPNFIMDSDIPSLDAPYPSQNTIAFFGRIAKRKRPELLVEIAKKLPDDTQLIVQGPAGYGEEKLYDQIISMLKNLGVTVLESSYKPDSKIIDSRYFINPSEVEGCSNALLEAMSRGSIPLISDIKENKKVLGGLLPLCVGGQASSYVQTYMNINNSSRELEIQTFMRKHILQFYSEQKVARDLVTALTIFKD